MKSRRCDQEGEEERRTEDGLPLRRRAVDDALLEKTIQLFQNRTGRTLSKEDARQIVENVTGFFQVLAEWDRAERGVRGQASSASEG